MPGRDAATQVTSASTAYLVIAEVAEHSAVTFLVEAESSEDAAGSMAAWLREHETIRSQRGARIRSADVSPSVQAASIPAAMEHRIRSFLIDGRAAWLFPKGPAESGRSVGAG